MRLKAAAAQGKGTQRNEDRINMEFIKFSENIPVAAANPEGFISLGVLGALLISYPLGRKVYSKFTLWQEGRRIKKAIYDGSFEREVLHSYKDPDSKP